MSNIIWIIVIGFVAGIIARLLSPGPNEPSGFILTTVLGIAGAFLATFIGQTIGWYRLDQGAGFIGATVGALIVLFIWNRLVVHRVLRDPGVPTDSGTGQRALAVVQHRRLDHHRGGAFRRKTWDCSISSMACRMVLAANVSPAGAKAAPAAGCRRS